MRFIAIALLLISSFSKAETKYETLELLSYQVSSSFSAYIFFEGQQQHFSRAHRLLRDGLKLLNTNESEHPELVQLWQQAQTFIDEHENNLSADPGREANWMIISQKINSTLSSINKTYSSEDIRLRIELEKVLALYMKFANAPAGGFAVLLSDGNIDEHVNNISAMLKNNTASSSRLRKQWRYIRKTLLNYNTSAAPYIVMKVVGDMSNILGQQSTGTLASD